MTHEKVGERVGERAVEAVPALAEENGPAVARVWGEPMLGSTLTLKRLWVNP